MPTARSPAKGFIIWTRRAAATARRSMEPCAAGCQCRREFFTAFPIIFRSRRPRSPNHAAWPITPWSTTAASSQAIACIVGLERDRTRLAIAERYGCTALVGGVEDWARDGDGLGVDGVIDAAGVSATLKLALDLVRPAGWISKVGWGPQPVGISLDPLVQKNITLQGSFSHNWPIWERVIRLLSTGILDVEPIIGGIWPLAQWRTAFET